VSTTRGSSHRLLAEFVVKALPLLGHPPLCVELVPSQPHGFIKLVRRNEEIEIAEHSPRRVVVDEVAQGNPLQNPEIDARPREGVADPKQ
jgi:hypothetical protein